MDLSNELFCEPGSFSHHHNHYRFLQPEISRLSFPISEPWVWRSVSLPSCSSQFMACKCGTAQSTSHHLACPGLPVAAWPPVLSTQLPISTPPTGLDECVFLNSLVVRLPYILIFCQFWFFVFKFVVVLLLVVQGGTMCLPTPLSWLEVPKSYLFLYLFPQNSMT